MSPIGNNRDNLAQDISLVGWGFLNILRFNFRLSHKDLAKARTSLYAQSDLLTLDSEANWFRNKDHTAISS